MDSTTNSTDDIHEDPNWINFLSPTQQKVLSDLKNQQQQFDVQYLEWQHELEIWKKANINHSDPKKYRDDAQQWEEWRNKLLAQKDQMQQLYKLTLVQLKSQASKQKEQKKQPPQQKQTSTFQPLEKISTEGLTTIIEKIDVSPHPLTNNQASGSNLRDGSDERRHHESYHKNDSPATRTRPAYLAKTIHYDHGSPLIGVSLPDGPPRAFSRFASPLTQHPPGLRDPPQQYEYGYPGPRGAIRQLPPYNRLPYNSSANRGSNYSPMSTRPPLRSSFNERPSLRPQIRGNSSIPVQLPTQVYPSPQEISQRSAIPIKELTFKDEEYYTAPPSKVVSLEELLYPPTRDFRPKKILIILRGLPGSGKTHLAKLIRDKEAEYCVSTPRILSIDDYFMVEKDVITDENGKQIKAKEFVYEFEQALEESYRASLLKAFKKTSDAPYFEFIIVDAVNCLVPHFQEFHSYASSKGFTTYICEMSTKDPETCVKTNIHNRSLTDIRKLSENWHETPDNYIKLDSTSFLQRVLQEEVIAIPSESNIGEKRRNTDAQEDYVITKKLASGVNPSRDDVEAKEKLSKSRWEQLEESSKVDHDRLDSFKVKRKITMDEYLQLPDDNDDHQSNRKRVRWADVEERKNQQKMRNLGFVVGQNWERVLDPNNPERALNKTKYI